MEWPVWCNPWMERALRKVLAENLGKLKAHRNLTEGQLAKNGGIGTGSAHRALVGQNASLATLQGLAKAVGLPAWALLFPGLEPAKPPPLTPAAIEAEVRRRVKERWDAISGQLDDLRVAPDEEKDGPFAAEPPTDRPRPPKGDAPARKPKGSKA